MTAFYDRGAHRDSGKWPRTTHETILRSSYLQLERSNSATTLLAAKSPQLRLQFEAYAALLF